MITRKNIIRTYSSHNDYSADSRLISEESIFKNTEVLCGTSSELLEHFQQEILSYDSPVIVDRRSKEQYPFKVTMNDTNLSVLHQFNNNPKHPVDNCGGICYAKYINKTDAEISIDYYQVIE